jgi:hypothetical protein
VYSGLLKNNPVTLIEIQYKSHQYKASVHVGIDASKVVIVKLKIDKNSKGSWNAKQDQDKSQTKENTQKNILWKPHRLLNMMGGKTEVM